MQPNPQSVQTGTILAGQFRVERLLGTGGLGPLYKAFDGESNRPVAVRLLADEIVSDEGTIGAVRGLVENIAPLSHKNLVATLGLATDSGNWLLVEEYVDGRSLLNLLEKKRMAGKTFTLKGAYNVVAHVCNALAYVHSKVIHGALHPGNILVNRSGRIKVADVGMVQALASLGNMSSIMARKAFFYLAPEVMAEPETADARADVYSIGVLLTELLTGQSPSETLDLPSKVQPGLPEELDQLVARCLSPSPAERFSRVDELKQAMLSVIDLVARTRAASGSAAAVGAPQARAAAAGPKPGGRPGAPLTTQPGMGTPARAPGRPAAPIAVDIELEDERPEPGVTTSGQFDLVSMVSGAAGEDEEKYLIQKNKLDYGPFSFNDVKVQIRVGEIDGNDFIVDNSTGQRVKVKDHPLLGEYFAGVERHKELQRRAATETATQQTERRKKHIFALTAVGAALVIGGVVAAILIYQGAAARKRKPTRRTESKLSYEAGWEEDEGGGMSGRRRRRRSRGGWGGGKWDDTQRLDFGSDDGPRQTLTRGQIYSIMSRYNQRIGGCLVKHGASKVSIRLQIKGNGRLAAVRTNLSGAADACVKGAVRAAKFPTFAGTYTNGSYTLRVQ